MDKLPAELVMEIFLKVKDLKSYIALRNTCVRNKRISQTIYIIKNIRFGDFFSSESLSELDQNLYKRFLLSNLKIQKEITLEYNIFDSDYEFLMYYGSRGNIKAVMSLIPCYYFNVLPEAKDIILYYMSQNDKVFNCSLPFFKFPREKWESEGLYSEELIQLGESEVGSDFSLNQNFAYIFYVKNINLDMMKHIIYIYNKINIPEFNYMTSYLKISVCSFLFCNGINVSLTVEELMYLYPNSFTKNDMLLALIEILNKVVFF